MIPLNPEQLMVATGSNRANADLFLPFLQCACKAYDITSPLRIAAFLSQIGHESAGLSRLEENLNYSATGLAATWPTRFAQRDTSGAYLKDAGGLLLPTERALLLHRKPEMIANSVYANRMGNGSEESGDGWRHRGFGLKQLTGKDNHRACGLAIGENFELHPERLMLPVNAALSAGWFWSVNKLNRFADAGDVRGLTLAINGGTIGLAQRDALYQQALPAFT